MRKQGCTSPQLRRRKPSVLGTKSICSTERQSWVPHCSPPFFSAWAPKSRDEGTGGVVHAQRTSQSLEGPRLTVLTKVHSRKRDASCEGQSDVFSARQPNPHSRADAARAPQVVNIVFMMLSKKQHRVASEAEANDGNLPGRLPA